MITLPRRVQLFHGRHEIVEPEWQDLLNEVGIGHDDRWLSLSGEAIAAGGVTKCYRMQLGNGELIYFKRYRYSVFRPQFWMLPSKANVEISGYRTMRRIGMATPDVIAYGEKRCCGALCVAFLVSREIPHTTNMEVFAHEKWFHMDRPQRKAIYEQLSRQIMQMIKHMHANHFYHYDLKWRNVLVQEQDDRYRAYLIDCPRSRHSLIRARHGETVDISSLARIAMFYLRRTEQLRWLCKFTGDNKSAKRLFRRVQRHMRNRFPSDPRPENARQESI